MAMSFTQSDTSSTAGQYCSAVTSNAGCHRQADVGGTAGSTSAAINTNASDVKVSASFYCVVPSGTSWDAGDWTTRINITTSNMNQTITAIHICRVDSSGVNQATIGSATGLSISLGSTGVKSQTITGSAQTPAAGDVVVVNYTVTNGTMSFQSSSATPNQNIDSPFSQVTPSLVWDTLSAIRHLLTRKVFDFGRLAPAWSRRPSGLIVPRAANDDNIKLAA